MCITKQIAVTIISLLTLLQAQNCLTDSNIHENTSPLILSNEQNKASTVESSKNKLNAMFLEYRLKNDIKPKKTTGSRSRSQHTFNSHNLPASYRKKDFIWDLTNKLANKNCAISHKAYLKTSNYDKVTAIFQDNNNRKNLSFRSMYIAIQEIVKDNPSCLWLTKLSKDLKTEFYTRNPIMRAKNITLMASIFALSQETQNNTESSPESAEEESQNFTQTPTMDYFIEKQKHLEENFNTTINEAQRHLNENTESAKYPDELSALPKYKFIDITTRKKCNYSRLLVEDNGIIKPVYLLNKATQEELHALDFTEDQIARLQKIDNCFILGNGAAGTVTIGVMLEIITGILTPAAVKKIKYNDWDKVKKSKRAEEEKFFIDLALEEIVSQMVLKQQQSKFTI